MSRQKMPTRTEKRRDRPERRQESPILDIAAGLLVV
jgi:hypothetical protein